jgi:hypothetical protein
MFAADAHVEGRSFLGHLPADDRRLTASPTGHLQPDPETLNGYLEHLRGSALRYCNLTNYTPDYEEPVSFGSIWTRAHQVCERRGDSGRARMALM